MIIKYADYEQITPQIVDMLKESFLASSAYVDAILSKSGAKEWAESTAGLHALYLAMVEAKLDVKNAVIERLESGKPVFGNLPYYFNISHSCGRAVCVLHDKEVGVDIEFTKKKRNFELIADNFFSDGERAHFYESQNRQLEFYRIWTRKESILKCGSGEFEHNVLRRIDTYDYDKVNFTEIIRGGYLVTICVAAD